MQKRPLCYSKAGCFLVLAPTSSLTNVLPVMPPSAHASTSTDGVGGGSASEPVVQFDPIESAVEEIRAGKFVIVLDDENRENEGDLICAADAITTEQMAWFIRHTSGFICVSLHPALIEQLEIPMMVPINTERNRTAYTVTLDYRHGTTTGISAHDRALSSRKLSQAWRQSRSVSNGAVHPQQNGDSLVDKDRGPIRPIDFCRPGHLCPLRYTEGGVRRRRGHTEASVDLCLAADLPPAALLCELVDPNDEKGNIASRDACFAFARQHGLKVITIEALVAWREQREGPLADDKRASEQLDQERGVQIEQQQVVGPAHASSS